jgi:hypothetical protein
MFAIMKIRNKEDGIKAVFDGKAGELAVASQLFRRGIPVEFPLVDMGYDLRDPISGCRIQVKTAHRLTEEHKAKSYVGCYWFPLVKKKFRYSVSGIKKLVKKSSFSESCDFVVFYGMEDNRFWIVPAKHCDEVQALVLGFENPRRFSGDINELRRLNAEGISHEKLSEMFNCHRVTVTRLINSKKDYQQPSNFELGRRCENAWDKILDFGKPESVEDQEVLKEPNKWQILGVNSQSGSADTLTM